MPPIVSVKDLDISKYHKLQFLHVWHFYSYSSALPTVTGTMAKQKWNSVWTQAEIITVDKNLKIIDKLDLLYSLFFQENLLKNTLKIVRFKMVKTIKIL